MAKIIDTATDVDKLIGIEKFWSYNALDSCITHEVCGKILPQLDVITGRTYNLERSLQAPVLDMMRIGILIDQRTRSDLIDQLRKRIDKHRAQIKKLITEGYGYTEEFNPTSPDQVKKLLYDHLALPPILNRQGKPTADRDAVEKMQRYPLAKPLCKLILWIRDDAKTISSVNTTLDADNRWRSSFNIAGTKTGRFSSYASGDDTAANMQNLDPIVRPMFCSDKGMKLFYIDLEQAESRLVGAKIWDLFLDGKYLDACEHGDLHTTVAKMVWPHIQNRDDADTLYYRNFSHRFMCKRLGHGLSYYGQPPNMSRETRIPETIISAFKDRFFAEFPGIPEWHKWVFQQIASPGYIISMMGRKRWCFGRKDEDKTLREMIAYDPQESIASILNQGLFRIWWASHRGNGKIPLDIFGQIHDAILGQYPEHLESEILPQILHLIKTPLILRNNREFIIPTEVKVGWNWGEYDNATNIDGLRKWGASKLDTRARSRDPALTILD